MSIYLAVETESLGAVSRNAANSAQFISTLKATTGIEDWVIVVRDEFEALLNVKGAKPKSTPTPQNAPKSAAKKNSENIEEEEKLEMDFFSLTEGNVDSLLEYVEKEIALKFEVFTIFRIISA